MGMRNRGDRSVYADLGYDGFACPQVGVDPTVLELVVDGHARRVTEVFLERHQEDLGENAPGLAALLVDWVEQGEVRFDATWHAAFGDIHAALRAEDCDPAGCAAAAGLWLTECGQPGDWSASLSVPVRFRIGDRLLPTASAIRVSNGNGGPTVEIESSADGQAHEFTLGPDGWEGQGGERLPICQRDGFNFTVLPPGALPPTAAVRLLQADAYQFDASEVGSGDDWLVTCEAAVALIAEAAPIYVSWVDRVLRDLIPLQARPGTFNSGSDRFTPGAICISNQDYKWPLAEMLVHECTHQYLNILMRLEAIDDGSDEDLHYSPFRNKDRPLAFIVIAYHAFANVLLFYRAARARGMLPDPIAGSDAFANREETLDRQLRQIEPVLAGTSALTPIGRALWEPLYEQVRAEAA